MKLLFNANFILEKDVVPLKFGSKKIQFICAHISFISTYLIYHTVKIQLALKSM